MYEEKLQNIVQLVQLDFRDVKPQRNDAIFWHGLWKCAGRPTTGQLFEKMKHSWNEYHYAVRRKEQKAEALYAAQLIEAAVVVIWIS